MVTIAAGATTLALALASLGVLMTWVTRAHASDFSKSKPGGSIFRDGKFHNLIPGDDVMTRGSMFKTMREFLFDDAAVRVPNEPLPVQSRSAEEFATPPESGLRVTWFGHSTMLVELDGKRLLTDPIWSDRASPVGFAGPERFFPPPLPLEQLPQIDAVIISHDHYDHLDENTIKALAPKVKKFVVPLRVGDVISGWGIDKGKIEQLDWWQETRIGDLRLVCTPARHFSGRGILDRNQTLWASWAMIGPQNSAYFSGDGGMSPTFAEIGQRLGPFDVTMMEVGAYHPNWADIHSGPEQAMQAHKDLRGSVMMPIHWGTFNLAMHGWTEPAERLLVAAEKQSVALVMPQPGGSFEPATSEKAQRWWPKLPWNSVEQMPVISPGLEPPVGSLGDTPDPSLARFQNP